MQTLEGSSDGFLPLVDKIEFLAPGFSPCQDHDRHLGCSLSNYLSTSEKLVMEQQTDGDRKCRPLSTFRNGEMIRREWQRHADLFPKLV